MLGLHDAKAGFDSRVLLRFGDTLLDVLLFERRRLLPVDALQVRPVWLPKFHFMLIGAVSVGEVIELVRLLVELQHLLLLQCPIPTIHALLLGLADRLKNLLLREDLDSLRLLRLGDLHRTLVVSAHLSVELGFLDV